MNATEKMLEALLRSEGLIEWVGGYVYGRTSNDDPFVVLYPAAEHLKEKVCRVYPHQFKRLPSFIDTSLVPADTDGNPAKDKAQRAGIYHECPPFKIVMHLGRETQMGREKRFSDVLYVSQARPAETHPAAAPDDDERTHWRVEAAMASEPFMFDTAVVKMEPWFQNSEVARDFRQLLFGEWKETETAAYVTGLEAYATYRRQLNGATPTKEAHQAAKERALDAYRKVLHENA